MQGQSIIPDRLVISKDKKVTVIHYKSEALTEAHKLQIRGDAHVLESLGYFVEKKIVVSIQDSIAVEEF